jgi:hypothetical protein
MSYERRIHAFEGDSVIHACHMRRRIHAFEGDSVPRRHRKQAKTCDKHAPWRGAAQGGFFEIPVSPRFPDFCHSRLPSPKPEKKFHMRRRIHTWSSRDGSVQVQVMGWPAASGYLYGGGCMHAI